MKLINLKLKSFVTGLSDEETLEVKGGAPALPTHVETTCCNIYQVTPPDGNDGDPTGGTTTKSP